MENPCDVVLEGAYDLHTHCYPELRPEFVMALDDIEQAELARSRGLGGYILKSHIWPTMDRTFHIRRQVPGIDVVASITLNSHIGGVDAGVLETAIIQGARAAYLPTWTSANDIKNNGFTKRIAEQLPALQRSFPGGIRMIDDNGALTTAARDVLSVANEHGVLLHTGHISPAEVLAIADEATRIGFERLVFTHADSPSIGASDDEIVEVANRGAMIEWTMTRMLPMNQKVLPEQIVEWIAKLGADRCVLSTDAFGPVGLPQPDLFQLLVRTLHNAGLSLEDTRTMVYDNPRRLLSIPT